MPNNIASLQSSPKFVELLAASTQVYKTLSNISTMQTVLALTAALLGPIIAYYAPGYRAFGALYAISIIAIDFCFLEPWAKRTKKTGTLIQETFDVELFGLPWNSVKCGEKLKTADVKPWVDKYKSGDSVFSNIDRSWYPVQIEPVDLEYARLICQKSNFRWDSNLRKNYSVSLMIVAFAYVAIGVIVGLCKGETIGDYVLSILVPSLPFLRKLGDNCKNQLEWADKADKHHTLLNRVWDDAVQTQSIDTNRMTIFSRQIQDELFDRRNGTTPVPTALHRFLRPNMEAYMQTSADDDVRQVMHLNA